MSNAEHGVGEVLSSLLARKRGHVHLLGICGVGMAGLALLLRNRGFTVTGCDQSPNRLAAWLEARGIRVRPGHSPDHLASGVDWLIRSAAVDALAEETGRASAAGIPVFKRGEVLPQLLFGKTSIAVGGTHGKTTTTTFITLLLRAAGRDPAWCIGGENGRLGGVAGPDDGDPAVLVVEADESDGTLALYEPDIAVVTNIDFDHMEHFSSVKDFEDCFRTFVRKAKRRAIYCGDDPRAAAVCGAFDHAVSYGLSETAAVRGIPLRESESSSCFTLVVGGEAQGEIDLPVPGRHNIYNALAASAAGLAMGLSFTDIRDGLGRVALPRRRFERVAERRGVLVISDYGHHPSEISALVRTASRLPHQRLLAVFQPHRYTRTLALGPDFPAAFAGVDEVILTPVYAASEKPLRGGTSWDLYAHFRRPSSEPPRPEQPPAPRIVAAADSLDQAWAYLKGEWRAGDVLLVVGAGDVERIAGWAKDELERPGSEVADPGRPGALDAQYEADLRARLASSEIRRHEPLAPKTTFGVGGCADLWVRIGSLGDLTALLQWVGERQMPFRVIGAGSNLLVSDLGVRGVVGRLAGSDFTGIRADGETIVAGAGVPLARLLDWLEAHDLSGLEFLEGIPGTLGGALRMNAGAWGREIGERVAWIRCLNPDGAACTIPASSLEAGYRRCGCLTARIAVEAGLRPSPGRREEIRRHRRELADRRAWMRGLRCAGSVFRNPTGQFAGRLIEAAGLKGAKIGGATVSAAHANVIVADGGATASDIRALMEKVREEVLSRGAVGDLAPEIILLA